MDEQFPANIWNALAAWRDATETYRSVKKLRLALAQSPKGPGDEAIVAKSIEYGEIVLSSDTNETGVTCIVDEVIKQGGKLISIPMRLITAGPMAERALWVFQRWPRIYEEALLLKAGECVYVNGKGQVIRIRAAELRDREAKIRAKRRKAGLKGAAAAAARAMESPAPAILTPTLFDNIE